MHRGGSTHLGRLRRGAATYSGAAPAPRSEGTPDGSMSPTTVPAIARRRMPVHCVARWRSHGAQEGCRGNADTPAVTTVAALGRPLDVSGMAPTPLIVSRS